MKPHFQIAVVILVSFHTPALIGDDFTPLPLHVPAGFTVEVAAAPPLVKYPMMACLDERGRLFVAETLGQNLDKEQLLQQRCRFIRMLEDTDGDGQFDKSTIFADELVMPEGALWHRGALFVLSSPYLWKLEDRDGDGVAEHREKLVGAMEFNGKANQHGAYLGPNGRLYFSGGTFGYDLVGSDGESSVKGSAAGIFSCRENGTDVEVFGNGGINPVEVAFTPEGEMLSTCAIFDNLGGRHDALIHWIRGAACGPKDFRPPVLKTTGYRVPALSRWGQVAPSGLMRYRGTAYGPRYQNAYFSAHFNTGKVVNTRIERQGATFRSSDEDFLSSTSKDFHPTDILEDADGSLLLVDTGGWFRISCPASKVAKPKILGAIYRIRRQGAVRSDDPRGSRFAWDQATAPQLVELLDDARPVVRDRAIQRLVQLGSSAAAALDTALSSESVQRRRNAVWTLSQIEGEPARWLIRRALSDSNPTVRQAAVRSLGVLRDPHAADALIGLLTSDTPSIRRAAATALGQIGDLRATAPLLNSAAEAADDFLKHAIIYALIEIGDSDQILPGLTSSNGEIQQAALVALDRLGSERLRPAQVLPLLEADHAVLKQTALQVLTSRAGWSDQVADFLDGWLGGRRGDSNQSTTVRETVAALSQADPIQGVVSKALLSRQVARERRLLLLEAIGLLDQLPDAWARPLHELLAKGDRGVQRQVVAALTSARTTRLHQPLQRLAEDRQAPYDLRIAAWGALARNGGALTKPGFDLLMGQLGNNASAPLDRLHAAQAIAAAQLDPAQLQQVAGCLSTLGALELPALLSAFEAPVDEPRGSQLGHRLLAALRQSPGTSNLQAERLRAILLAFPREVQQAGEALLTKLEVDHQKMDAHLRNLMSQLSKGDIQRGRSVFFGNKAACAACHRVDGQGGDIGPNLSQIGQVRKRPDLLEAILYPSSSTVNGYETYSVTTTAGRSHQGVIERTTARSIVLRNAERKEIVVARARVEELVRSPISIMPQGLEKSLTPEQLSDLLAYLESLHP